MDITQHIVDILKQQKMKEGHVTIFVVGSTASISTTEFEPGLRKDIPEMLERIAPSNARYHHDDIVGGWKWSCACAGIDFRSVAHRSIF